MLHSAYIHVGHREGSPRGIPNDLHRQDNRAKQIEPALLPTSSSAVTSYESGGGHITAPRPHGLDPLADDGVKQSMREQAFFRKFSFESIFDSIANGNGAPFEDAFMFYVDVSYRMSH